MRLLDGPLSERIVYDFSKGSLRIGGAVGGEVGFPGLDNEPGPAVEISGGERVGPLYDVIYEALMRVVAGPDVK